MSLRTWLRTYYPVTAEDCAAAARSEAELIVHSLRKWRGLRADALRKHNVTARGYDVLAKSHRGPRQASAIGADHCALCVWHLERSNCSTCPLMTLRGAPCDRQLPDEKHAPWAAWGHYDKPGPMIALLERALAAERTKAV